jgi:hypothetical protein
MEPGRRGSTEFRQVTHDGDAFRARVGGGGPAPTLDARQAPGLRPGLAYRQDPGGTMP